MPKSEGNTMSISQEPTEQQIASTCLAFRHDYGLMSPANKWVLENQCKAWWSAIAKEINHPSEHPYVIAEGERIASDKLKATENSDAREHSITNEV